MQRCLAHNREATALPAGLCTLMHALFSTQHRAPTLGGLAKNWTDVSMWKPPGWPSDCMCSTTASCTSLLNHIWKGCPRRFLQPFPMSVYFLLPITVLNPFQDNMPRPF